MKKLSILLTLLIALALVFASCGAATNMMAKDELYFTTEDSADINLSFGSNSGKGETLIDGSTTTTTSNDLANRKLIKDATMEVQTKTFDVFMDELTLAIARYSGFVQNSSVRGSSYTSANSRRSANITARIPAEELENFKTDVSGIGNVTYYNESLRDVTLSYVDTESHIKALKAEQEALLNLLAKADYIEAIIEVQTRLTEVNYQLETYESHLRTYDDLIAYSTITINVSEVERVTIVEKQNAWQRMGTEFVNNLKDILSGAENFFVWFVASIPYIILIAVAVVVVVIVLRRIIKKKKNAIPSKTEE